MPSQPQPPPKKDALHRILARLAASRFLTISIVIHAVAVLMIGTTVLFKVAAEPPDFEASGDGFLVEASASAEPPAAPTITPVEQQFTPQAPALSAPISALVTASQTVPTWTVAAVPNAPAKGLSDSMKSAMANVGDKLGQSGGLSGSAMGKLGGMRSAMIFGKKVEATKLGVILDVSGSAHPHLAGAIDEIQKGFADATLILYPGCGLLDVKPKNKAEHEIRKYSTIPKKDIDDAAGKESSFTTPGQLFKALKIDAFEKMTKKPSTRDTLFVSWYEERGADGKPTGQAGELIGQAQVAFEDLMKRGVDTIYWFADFKDKADPKVTERLIAQMKSKKVKLYIHNFSGDPTRKEVVEMAEKTGGTVDDGKKK